MSVYKNGVLVPVAPAVHGAAQHTDITRELFIPACEGFLAAGVCNETPNGAFSSVLGDANAPEPAVYFSNKVPDDFVSFISVKAVWLSEAAGGNMYWNLSASYAASGQTEATHTDTPAIGVTATGGNDIINVQEPANALTLASLAIGDYLGMVFARDGTDANDTLDAEVYLLGLLFTYVANQ